MDSPVHDTEVVIANVRCLLVANLKCVLRLQGQKTSGPKAILQERIISLMWQYFRTRNFHRYNELADSISNPNQMDLGNVAFFQPQNERPYILPSGLEDPAQLVLEAPPYRADQATYPTFRESPFYSVLEPLTPVPESQALAREASRDQLHVNITIKTDVANKLLKDPCIKAMIYCTSDILRPRFPFQKVDISFPKSTNIKVNDQDVKADFKGVTGRSGSTRPADITNLLLMRPGYQNFMTVKYPPNIRKFHFVVNLVKKYSAQYLLNRVKFRKPISIEQVMQDMVKRGSDSDVVTTSSIMTLECPLSLSRINIPCRSTMCIHNQCFDALSFLQLQEQAPTWQCPICNGPIGFDELAIDQYVANILAKTSQEVERVTIEPDGTWNQTSIPSPDSEPTSDEKFAEESIVTSSRSQSKEQSKSNFATAPPGKTKRPSAIIEISSDEDEDDQSPIVRKRPRPNSQSIGYSPWPFR